MSVGWDAEHNDAKMRAQGEGHDVGEVEVFGDEYCCLFLSKPENSVIIRSTQACLTNGDCHVAAAS